MLDEMLTESVGTLELNSHKQSRSGNKKWEVCEEKYQDDIENLNPSFLWSFLLSASSSSLCVCSGRHQVLWSQCPGRINSWDSTACFNRTNRSLLLGFCRQVRRAKRFRRLRMALNWNLRVTFPLLNWSIRIRRWRTRATHVVENIGGHCWNGFIL